MLFLAGFGGTVIFTQNVFFFNIIRLGEEYLITGDFDRFLVRPLNPLFQDNPHQVRSRNNLSIKHDF
ncbi:hypothetical protein HRED_10052 [Candidatus Haloredivivus sp. G17]|nr:hypothetical protein HRED_10052 [Candidatus Haloredivivus sp. G17]